MTKTRWCWYWLGLIATSVAMIFTPDFYIFIPPVLFLWFGWTIMYLELKEGRVSMTNRKCERFSCDNDALPTTFQIAPGTNVFYCQKCKNEELVRMDRADEVVE